MIKLIKIFSCLIVLAFLPGCDDAIEINQPGRLDANAAFNNTNDLRLGLFSTYNRIDITHEIMHAATFTDEISIGFDNGGQGLGDGRYGFILNTISIAPTEIWTRAYRGINSATRVILAAQDITPESDEVETYNSIVAQAKAIRALFHFQLFAYFSPSYTNDGDLSGIVVDFIPTVDDALPRNTVGEIVAAIEQDLNEAFPDLPAESEVTFINQDFVTALRARLAAYRQDYSTALSNAQQLIDKYPLANKDQYVSMYNDMDNTEVIFKLERSIGDTYDTQATEGGGWAGSLFAFVGPSIEGSPYFEMSRSLFNGLDPNDARYDAMIHPTSLIDPDYASNPNFRDDDILVISKYPGSEGQPLMNDLKVFRVSEMYLIAAEANAALGNLEAAAGLIDQIREARFGMELDDPSYGSEAEALGDIMDERRIELALEGHRYLDLKRLGNRANRSVDRDPLDCQINGACEISNDDNRFTFPIPQVELDGNATIRDQQNPGY